MDDSSAFEAADRAEFSLLWLEHACEEEDCADMCRALLSIAQCMGEMGDAQTAAELRALVERHRGHIRKAPADRRPWWQGRGQRRG